MSRIATSAGSVESSATSASPSAAHADDLVPRRLEQHQQALAEQGTVLGQRYSHGILAVIVPGPGPPATSIVPPSRRTWSSIAPACATFTPLSSTDSMPPSDVTHTPHRDLDGVPPARRRRPSRRRQRLHRGQAPDHGEVGGALDRRPEPVVGGVDPDRDRPRGRPPRAAPGRARPRRAAAGRSCPPHRAAPGARRAARPGGRRRTPAGRAPRRATRCRKQAELQGERGDPQRGAVVQLPFEVAAAHPLLALGAAAGVGAGSGAGGGVGGRRVGRGRCG